VDPTLEFFFTDRARAFFSLRAILTYVVRASRRPGQVGASRRPTQVPARESPPPFPRRGRVRRRSWMRANLRGRAAASSVRRREDTRTAQMASRLPENNLVEKSRGVEGCGGTESDVEGRNCKCKVVGRFA